MWMDPLRTTIAVLFLAASWSTSAQTEQNEKLRQVIFNLRTCVRTSAPTAHAEGVRTMSDAAKFFDKKCGPPASNLAVTDVGTVPPGSFQHAISEEWATFLERSNH